MEEATTVCLWDNFCVLFSPGDLKMIEMGLDNLSSVLEPFLNELLSSSSSSFCMFHIKGGCHFGNGATGFYPSRIGVRLSDSRGSRAQKVWVCRNGEWMRFLEVWLWVIFVILLICLAPWVYVWMADLLPSRVRSGQGFQSTHARSPDQNSKGKGSM